MEFDECECVHGVVFASPVSCGDNRVTCGEFQYFGDNSNEKSKIFCFEQMSNEPEHGFGHISCAARNANGMLNFGVDSVSTGTHGSISNPNICPIPQLH